MKKTTLLGIAVTILLIVNVITLGFIGLQMGRPAQGGGGLHPEPREIIMQKLNFDDKQRAEYEGLIRAHREAINGFDSKIRDNKQALYALLSTDNTTQKDSLIAIINGYQKQIEETHFNHFKDIKTICRPDQIAAYNELTNELPMLFAPPQQRGRP